MEKAFEDNGTKILGLGWQVMFIGSKKRAVLAPDDAKGLKLRGPSKGDEELLRAAGASITSMPTTEVYMALQTGVLDGLFTAPSSFDSFRLYEVIDYIAAGKDKFIGCGSQLLLLSNKTFAKLSQEQKNIVLTTGRETEKMYNDDVLKEDGRVVELLTQKGIKVSFWSDANFAAWQELAKKTAWKTFAESTKGGQQMIDGVLSLR